MSQAAETLAEFQDRDGAEMLRVSDLHAFYGESHILHRCWGDREKAAVVSRVVRNQALPFQPDHLPVLDAARRAFDVYGTILPGADRSRRRGSRIALALCTTGPT